MSFTVSICKDPILTGTVKYRNPFPAAAIRTVTTVNIGNFSNLNLFCDNAVEVGLGQMSPPISTYEDATSANFIKIEWGAYTVIGHITDWDYINDSNVKITYSVDPFTSAVASGLIDNIDGLCERVNMLESSFKSNLQSEPFSPSDLQRTNATMTSELNALALSLENLPPSWNGIDDSNTCLILTVSPAIIEYLGVGAFAIPPTGFAQQLKNRATLLFDGGDSTSHAGGTYRGTPLKFMNMNNVKAFITQILGGCGFRTQLAPDGATGQNATSYHSYITNANSGAGQNQWQNYNANGFPMESIRFITSADIYNLYCIPLVHATPIAGYPNKLAQIHGLTGLGNLHPWGGENASAYKLISHPYNYHKIVTANGDAVQVIPQTHYTGNAITGYINVWVRYIGGDTPKMQAMIGYNDTNSPVAQDDCIEWFTVRNYPAVTLSINDSFNPQIQKDVANTRKINATLSVASANARLKNPIKSAYWDTVNGTAPKGQGNRGAGGTILSWVGTGLGMMEGGNHEAWGNLFKNEPLQNAQNEATTLSAGNFITPEQLSVMGNDFMAQLSQPCFAAYNCGATDTERFTFARYLEKHGGACNSFLNPLTNAGRIPFGTVTPVNGRTFYQYGYIDVEGNMPIQWKVGIVSLFTNGVYLVD